LSWKVTFRLRADPPVLRIIRKLAAEAARAEGLSSTESAAVEVAVGETLAAAYHTYGAGSAIELELEFDGLGLVITLHDHDKSSAEAALSEEGPLKEPGRRLHLIRQLVDKAEVLKTGSPGPRGGIRLRKKVL
jgi:hypothetical protein